MPCPLFQSKENAGVWWLAMPLSLKSEICLYYMSWFFSLSANHFTLKAMDRFSLSLQRDLNNWGYSFSSSLFFISELTNFPLAIRKMCCKISVRSCCMLVVILMHTAETPSSTLSNTAFKIPVNVSFVHEH